MVTHIEASKNDVEEAKPPAIHGGEHVEPNVDEASDADELCHTSEGGCENAKVGRADEAKSLVAHHVGGHGAGGLQTNGGGRQAKRG